MAYSNSDDLACFYQSDCTYAVNADASTELELARQGNGQHRTYDPLEYLQSTQLARVGRELSIQRLTKHEFHMPWSGQCKYEPQQQDFSNVPMWQEDLRRLGTKTEPISNAESSQTHRLGYLESFGPADSAYASTTVSSVPHDDCHSNDFESQQLAFSTLEDFGLLNKVISPSRSVESEGHHISRPRDSRRRQHIGICPFPGCGRPSKNPSDAKKHELTHTKPHRCTEPFCERKEGFATDNDLQRHRKSVHNLLPMVGSQEGYICAACPVTSSASPKFWPRRDNFKAHIKRKHQDIDERHLIEVSKRHMKAGDVLKEDSTIMSTIGSCFQQQHDYGQLYPCETALNVSHNMQDDNDQCNVFSDQSIGMQENAFAGMGGHATGMDESFPRFALRSMSPVHDHVLNVFAITEASTDFFEGAIDGSSLDEQKVTHHDIYEHEITPSSKMTGRTSSSNSRTIRRKSSTTSSSTRGEFQCPNCEKTKSRGCDLKKHMKRHTRPYGCTFPRCDKRFGSRNDWKRHESSIHSTQHMWQCGRSRMDGSECSLQPFADANAWHEHGLQHLTDAQVDQECASKVFGTEQFWCGFCVRLVGRESDSSTTWEARLKHIGDHFDKQKMDIDSWIDIGEDESRKCAEEMEEAERSTSDQETQKRLESHS